MVAGEGFVFLLLLLLGFRNLQKSIDREVKIAHTHQNFLLSVTHELNTPLTAIKLYLQTILKRDLDKKHVNEILNNSISEADRLKGLVDNILTSARIDENELQLQPTRQNLGELVLNFITPKQDQEGFNRIKTSIEQNVFCNVDPLAISSIMQNLIENALKYDPKQQAIEILIKQENTKAILQITDNGIGISEDQKEAVFQKFYRIQSEKTRTTKGTGLGLFIVKELVEIQNGEIEYLPNNPVGSIFKIKFPIKS